MEPAQLVSPIAPPTIRSSSSRSTSVSGSGCQMKPWARLKASSGAMIASRSSGSAQSINPWHGKSPVVSKGTPS